jgi:formylglycine-generating enzyme required for sulfatase activity
MDSRFGAGIDHPVTGISWTEAGAFCRWLTRREQSLGSIPQEAAYRLPRIAEWRAAVTDNPAAGGAQPFAWGSAWPPPAGFANVASSETKPVKSYQANAGGFHDLAGNAAEWCADAGGDDRPYCGGSWKSSSRDELQIDAVKRAPAGTQSPEIGFRLVLDFHGSTATAP